MEHVAEIQVVETRTHLSYIFNITALDDLAMQGAIAPASMVLT